MKFRCKVSIAGYVCVGAGRALTVGLGAWLVRKEAFFGAVHVILYTLSEACHFVFQPGSSAPVIRFKPLNIADTTLSYYNAYYYREYSSVCEELRRKTRYIHVCETE